MQSERLFLGAACAIDTVMCVDEVMFLKTDWITVIGVLTVCSGSSIVVV